MSKGHSSKQPSRTFSRYTISPSDETQYEPGSHGRVLKNKLGIRSKREMDRIELKSLERLQEELVDEISTDQILDVKLVNNIHRRLFDGTYEWAGKYRSVNVSKDGFTWPPALLIATNMDTLDTMIKALTPCHGDSTESVARSIAKVHAELLFIHPYRDGNGRVARVIALLMALQAGYSAPHYGFRGKGSRMRRGQYIAALQEGYLENLEPLTAFFVEALEAGRRSLTA